MAGYEPRFWSAMHFLIQVLAGHGVKAGEPCAGAAVEAEQEWPTKLAAPAGQRHLTGEVV